MLFMFKKSTPSERPINFYSLRDSIKELPFEEPKRALEEAFISMEKNRCQEALQLIKEAEKTGQVPQPLQDKMLPYKLWCQFLVEEGLSSDTFTGMLRSLMARLRWILWPFSALFVFSLGYSVYTLGLVFKDSQKNKF